MLTNDKVSIVDSDTIVNEYLIECEFEIGSGGRLPYYEGEYEVVPKTIDQTLSTERKSMKQDIKVVAIPTEEVSNLCGTTFAIAREGV